MVKTELFVLVLLVEQRDIDDAIRQVDAAARPAGAFQAERFLVELRRFLSIRNDDCDMTNSGHEGTFPCSAAPQAPHRFPPRGNPPSHVIRAFPDEPDTHFGRIAPKHLPCILIASESEISAFDQLRPKTGRPAFAPSPNTLQNRK